MTTTRLLGLCLLLALPAAAQQGRPGGHFIDNWDLDGDGAVTEAEIESKRDALFTMFDMDENGLLDSAEWTLFEETRKEDMATNLKGEPRGAMLGLEQGFAHDLNDIDGDGAVSRAEFADRAPDAFTRMDIDADGVVTSADFGPGKG
ncbi:MAG: EF-hand domain-containing protein [Rhodobacteraceae bacterium]|nr:EF-hand domain-containing protein [Paracoccaceae bacterium]